jgi:hypothetical protein
VVTEKQDGWNGFVQDVFNLRYLWSKSWLQPDLCGPGKMTQPLWISTIPTEMPTCHWRTTCAVAEQWCSPCRVTECSRTWSCATHRMSIFNLLQLPLYLMGFL